MSPPQVFSFFHIRNGASPQLDNSQCSHTSFGKAWLFSFPLSITTDLELIVLIFFFICITSVSLSGALGTAKNLQITEHVMIWSSQRYSKANWTQPWQVCSQWPCFEGVEGLLQTQTFCKAISGLSGGKHVCTVTPQVTLQFYLATEDKLGNINVLCFHLACSMTLSVEKFTASLSSWDAS